MNPHMGRRICKPPKSVSGHVFKLLTRGALFELKAYSEEYYNYSTYEQTVPSSSPRFYGFTFKFYFLSPNFEERLRKRKVIWNKNIVQNISRMDKLIDVYLL